jgi:hypothetical protein
LPGLSVLRARVRQEGLAILTGAGVFNLRTCKLCADGIVVMGEYGLTNVLLGSGFNVATLMAKYPRGIDWRDQRHWSCNNNVHPSRRVLPHAQPGSAG